MSVRVDAHIHLFRDGFDDGERVIQAGVDDYEALRGAAGVSTALVVGYEGAARYAGNNAYVRSLASSHPWIRSLAYVPAGSLPSGGELARLRAEGHEGVALYLAEPGARLDDWGADAREALSGALVSVNAGPAELARFGGVLGGWRDTTVLVSHLGLPGPVDDENAARARLAPLLALAASPHVVVKVSGLYAIDPVAPYAGAAPVVRVVLDAFGSDRLVWGSDFSPALGFGAPDEVLALPAWLAAELSPAERAAVQGGTLVRLLAA